MPDEGTICGPGYSLRMPAGFTLAAQLPALGLYRLLPPGVTVWNVEALLQIRPVQPIELPQLLQNMRAFDQPMVAQANAMNLGLARVMQVMPFRDLPMPQGPACIREFEAVNPAGMPLRVMVLVIQGPQSAVELVVMMNLYRWAEFAGPCLSLVGEIQMQGAEQPPAQLQAKVDRANPETVEYQLAIPGGKTVPLTGLPADFRGTVIVQIENLIQTGNINGTGIVVGSHNQATVTAAAANQGR